MKTTRIVLLAAAGALALAACGEQQAEQAAAPEMATEPAAEAEPTEPSEPAEAEMAEAPAPAATGATGASGAAAVDADRLLNANAEPGQWMSHSRDYDETNFSPLTQITEDNVGDLGLAWFADLPTNQNIESTPIYIDGVIYLSLPWSEVQAFDAATGETLWHFDPEVPGEWNVNVCCGLDNRGVAAWNGKIYVGTLDGRLIAIDAETGEAVWDVLTIDPDWPYSITGAPRVANGMVVIGANGGEFGVRGHISAYDAETGEQIWRFYTVPGNPADGFESEAMEMAAETWKTPGWWEVGGGGPVWDGITYDTVNDLIIFGVGNGSPWSAEYRDPAGGDNLFLASIVALDATTGEYRWHYQEVPWETWDYDTTQQITIADIELDGEVRRVAMQASKNGVFYVLDAATGEFLGAEPFTSVNWVDSWDPETGRPNIVQDARYDAEDHTWIQAPGPAGGHAWQGMAYSPDTGLVYIPAQETYGSFAQAETYEPVRGGFNMGTAFGGSGEPVNPDAGSGTVARLVAWDPVAMDIAWQSEDVPARGGGVQMSGGAMATAGNIVFQSSLPQDALVAFRADTGEELWRYDVKTGIMPGPISYELDGVQYVAVAAGGPVQGGYYAPNGARLLVFALGATETLPDIPEYTQPAFVEAEQFATDDVVAHGDELFADNCALCHGQGGAARATFPDLRRSVRVMNQQAFDAVVLDGALSQNGMASFDERLDPPDTEAIRAYLISQAEAARNAPAFGGFGGGAPDEEEEEEAIHDDPNQ